MDYVRSLKCKKCQQETSHSWRPSLDGDPVKYEWVCFRCSSVTRFGDGLADIVAGTAAPLQDRLAVANQAVAIFAPETRLEMRRSRVWVVWTVRGHATAKCWVTRGGQGFYPVWHNKWPHGGTCCTALSQLIRWIRHQDVLPLSSWRYWCGPSVKLADENGERLLSVLKDGGYPESVDCVLCRQPLTGSLDWWSLDGVSGPCCNHRSGCRIVTRDHDG